MTSLEVLYFSLEVKSSGLESASAKIQNKQMRLFLKITLLSIYSFSSAWAALATNAPPAAAFFRNKTSLFPSGQLSRTLLESNLLRVEPEISFLTKWDGKEFILQDDEILRDIHVARFVETKSKTPIYTSPSDESLPISNLEEKMPLEILETSSLWAKVRQRNGRFEGWVHLQFLQNTTEDVGVFINLTDAFLFQNPSDNSQLLTTIPRLHRFIPLEIKDSYLKIQYGNIIGFANITTFVSRADFAQLAYHPQKKWVTIAYKNNNKLVTSQGEAILLKEVLGFVTNSSRGIIRKSLSEWNPPLRARVEIIKPEAHLWGVSHIEGHGDVWWKRKELIKDEKRRSAGSTITTEELLNREIYSIAFENKTSLKGLLSSEGVYSSEDGLSWTKITQFGSLNMPVSIHPDGAWIVGSYRSNNRGKSFEPFIKWDQVAQLINSAYHRNPKYLKLTKIDSLPDAKIQIHIDTGVSKVILRSSLKDIDWSIVKN